MQEPPIQYSKDVALRVFYLIFWILFWKMFQLSVCHHKLFPPTSRRWLKKSRLVLRFTVVHFIPFLMSKGFKMAFLIHVRYLMIQRHTLYSVFYDNWQNREKLGWPFLKIMIEYKCTRYLLYYKTYLVKSCEFKIHTLLMKI